MNTIQMRTLATAIALLATASVALAQARPAGIINSMELRHLLTRSEPADHATLSSHFGALAAQYTDEAKRHTAMASAFTGNPNRQNGSALGSHCARLAELNEQSAATLRELASHHGRLAAGTPSFAPPDAGRFEGGEGAPAPTRFEVAKLEAAARTGSDHAFLEEYFRTLAHRYESEAVQHAAMAQMYRGNANRRGGDPAVHCERLVNLSNESAAEARASAAEHRTLAR